MEATQTRTIQQFMHDNKITMTAEWTDNNPHMDDARNMDHWRVTLRMGKRQMSTYFSMGYGHKGREPEAGEVLDCLASDAAGFENARSFEEWASDYGYDTDSRKAERTYRTIEKQAARLKRFLGEDRYNELLWNTERL